MKVPVPFSVPKDTRFSLLASIVNIPAPVREDPLCSCEKEEVPLDVNLPVALIAPSIRKSPSANEQTEKFSGIVPFSLQSPLTTPSPSITPERVPRPVNSPEPARLCP